MSSKKPYSIYLDKGIYYIQICYNYKRIKRSLRVSNKTDALTIAKMLYPKLLKELISNESKSITFRQLISKYLSHDHGWSKRTVALYTHQLTQYHKTGTLPTNPNTRNMWVRCINACWNWGLQQGLVTKHEKIKQTKMYPRTKILGCIEIIKDWQPYEFMAMCRIMAEAGARVEEIRIWNNTKESFSPKDKCILVNTKGGGQMDSANKSRILRLNDELCSILTNIPKFNFTKDMGRKLLKNNCNEENLQLRDLRRTFAVNQYRKGTPMLSISRLMGHSSLAMTEWYLKPFTIEEIDL